MKASLLTASILVIAQALTTMSHAQSTNITQTIDQAQGFVSIVEPRYNEVPFLALTGEENYELSFGNFTSDENGMKKTKLALERAAEICKLMGHGEPTGVRVKHIDAYEPIYLNYVVDGAVSSKTFRRYNSGKYYYFVAKISLLTCKTAKVSALTREDQQTNLETMP